MNIRQEKELTANSDHFICPLCQAENRANAKFCRKCGNPRLDLAPTSEAASAQKKLERIQPIQPIQPVQPVQQNAAGETAPQLKPISKSTLCKHCQVQVRATDRYCSWCGQDGPRSSAHPALSCPKCENILPAQANFCYGCGEHVGPHKRLKSRPPGEIFQAEEDEFFPFFDA